MRHVPKALFLTTLLSCAATLVLPRASYAAACSNAHLSGTYSVRIGNSSVLSVVNSLNTASSSDTNAAVVAPTGGFGDNPNSLGGPTPGLGRYFLNGNGTIIGQSNGSASAASSVRYGVYSTVGTVTLNSDGGFMVAGWVTAAGSVQSVKAGGRYTIGSDCSLKLTFSGTPPSGTPTTLRGFLVNHGQGVFSIQPGAQATVTGQLFGQ